MLALDLVLVVECLRMGIFSTRFICVSLRFTPQGQYYGNRLGSFGFGPPVLFWDPRRLSWSVKQIFSGEIWVRSHFSAEKAQECFKAPKYLRNLMELDLKPKSVQFLPL